MDRILVVDDNPDFLGLLKSRLKSTFEVDTATTATNALKLTEKHPYKAVILDVSLPDFTGYYLGTAIRKQYPSMPMAFLTAYDGEVTRENAELLKARFWKKSDMVLSANSLVDDVVELCH